jgi:tryptophanyl-tRNA synthetase
MSKPIIVSGIKPTGTLNIGGYLGAIKNCVALQESGNYEQYIFIADQHALTTETNADRLRTQTVDLAATLLAIGIDPKKTTFFAQSHVPEHTELAWLFNCLTPVAELNRMTQFKDKFKKQEQSINTGLLTYPALMAADILMYHSTVIPVGEDQIQHVELTRDIARWFNNRYGNYFPEPKHLLTATPRVMGLLEPTKKMSKSDGNESNVIDLIDEPAVIEAKIKKAVTATEGGVRAPGVANLLELLREFGDTKTHEGFVKAEKDGTIRYGDLKKALAEAMSTYFADFRTERTRLLNNPEIIEKILADGAKKAKKIAEKTMADVRKLIGLR